ncbi:chromosome segregation protein SMC, partial [Candidatus Woesearchaeota archaeon]|nr:chromosome segregation protein SMC [Candidatus Woesearchaeota archaeon]
LFGEDFNCIVGPNGSGKSCAPDTEVLLADGSVRKIGELVEKELKNAKQLTYFDDGVFCTNRSKMFVFTLNPETMLVEKRPVAAFVRREGDPHLYNLTTHSNKSVVTTGCHPVMIFKNGCVQSEVVEKLSPGCFIAAPRKIPLEGKQTALPKPTTVYSRCAHDENITLPTQTSSALGRWLGLTIGDGHIRHNRIELVNADEQLVEEWITLSKNLFNFSDPYVRKEGISKRIIYHTRKLPAFLAQLFSVPEGTVIKSDLKNIPDEFMKADFPTIAALISGLIDTDGYVSATTPTLEFTSKNKELVDQVQLLLLRFGILSRKKVKLKYASNTEAKIKREYATLTIEGRENLEKCTRIPIMRKLKHDRLYYWTSREIVTNPNTDVLPEETNIFVKKLVKLLGLKVKCLRKEHPYLSAYVENRCCPSRQGIEKVVDLAEERFFELSDTLKTIKRDQHQLTSMLKLANISMRQASAAIGLSPNVITDYWATERVHARQENLELLHDYLKEELSTRLTHAESIMLLLSTLCSSDISWERIESIEKVPGTQFVYDLCILENHNFIANNIFVHNSNVLDALCFVLGKSSSKQLRAEKSANLIYNGGKTKQPAKAAEVSIVFDNSNKTFPVDGSEVKISRIVRADGASKYKINNETKTRQEVVELLQCAKVDPDGYNIILQGDIVRLVEMSPVERRQIIEEIAGIGMYEEKKQQALNELEKVGQRLNEAEIILKEREGYLKDLKKDRDQALKYKELNDNVKRNKASYLKRQIDRKDGERLKVEERSQGHKDKFDKLQEQVKKLREEIAQRKQQIVDMNAEIEKKGEVEQIGIQKEVERLKVEVATKKTRASALNTEVERIKQRREQLGRNAEEVDAKTKELSGQRDQLSAQSDALKKTVAELDSKMKEFRKKHGLVDDSDIDRQFADLDKKAEEKQRELQTLREKQQSLIREKDKAEFQLTTIDEKIAKVSELEAAHKEEVVLLKRKKDQFKKLALELNELLNQDSKDASTMAKSRVELHHLTEEEHKLSIRQSAVQEHIATNIAVKKVLEQRGKFGEVYGTVAELGSSDSQFALALDIAAAQKIHSVVVDSDKTAAAAIKYLKQERLGFATFLPMNKVRPALVKDELKGVLKENGVLGLAIDLIDFDPKFKNVFSHVFGNTVVVEDIETARRIGIGNIRMVTLEGDLCEHSGAMTGGYRGKKSGSFREKELESKLAEVRNRVDDLESSLSQLDKSRKLNEEKISKLRELKANLEGEIIKEEKSLHLDTGDFEASRNFKDDLQKAIGQLNGDLLKLEEELAEQTQQLTSLKVERQGLRDRIAQLRNPRVLAELNAFEEKKKQLEQEVVRLDAEQKGLSMQLTDILGRDRENIGTLLKTLDKEESQFSSERAVLDKEVKAEESELSKREKEQAAFFSQFKELFDKRNKLSQDINDRETKILGVEENSRKEELSLNTLSIEIARIKAEFAGLSAEFEQFAGIELDVVKPEEQLKKEIADFERLMASIGSVNMRALEIYDAVEREYAVLNDKKKVLLKERDDVLGLMSEIEKNKKDLFLRTLTSIDTEFQRIFGQLMTKGSSYLELENVQDPFAAGLHINVKITGNKFLDIRSLSGGEKTMTALAFLFALQEYEPATFYVLDEVDAALDKHNSEKLAKLIRSYCSKAQYVVISHNDALIAEGDILYGVSMNPEAGLSSVVSLKI